MQRFRWLSRRLVSSERRRLVILTGARQTGKTTLARRCYPDLRYVNLDSLENRELLRRVPSAEWSRAIGPAVLDEAQKEPDVFEKVKFAFDDRTLDFSVLLGSSRILLLDRVRESLTGRAFCFELWPLTASELRTPADGAPELPLFDRLIEAPRSAAAILGDEPAWLLPEDAAPGREALDHLAAWGGMPALLGLDPADRREWLRSYHQIWVQRDLSDLGSIRDFLPFRTLSRLAMLRSGGLVNFTDLGRDAGVSATTARRYLDFLRLSYQAILLEPFRRNRGVALTKTPKLYWTDLGLLRQGTGWWEPLTGPMFETLVIVEAHKWIATLGRDAHLSFWRTRGGREVDLVVSTADGVLGIEMKNRRRIEPRDASALRALEASLGPDWAGGLIVHRGDELAEIAPGVWAVPAHRLF